MQKIADIAALEALYGDALTMAVDKVASRLTPLYRRWIGSSRFAVLATVGPEGTDASPRGDDGPVVRCVGDRTLIMPDWRGNRRIDSLRNIVRDGRVSLMFMVPGCNNVVRVNGAAVLIADDDLCGSFEQGGKHPRTVIVVTIGEIYYQCAKALMRSGLWLAGDEGGAVPTAGEFVREFTDGFDAGGYDDVKQRFK